MEHPNVTPEQLKAALLHHLTYTLGKDAGHATLYDWRVALAYVARDHVVDPWFAATRASYGGQMKRVYYLSMEFLIGRLLEDALVNLRIDGTAQTVLADLGLDYAAVICDEPDAALGNGGLGRLAACFLESLSSLSVPAMGYGIRYEHGLFKQSFDAEGRQVERPEDWLMQTHVWEFERPEAEIPIGFGGHFGPKGWEPAEQVIAPGP